MGRDLRKVGAKGWLDERDGGKKKWRRQVTS